MAKVNLKILLFLCNWGPHAAYQSLQDQGSGIPLEVKMVRIPCTGRISKALLFKAFEMGADGVALVGCAPGACRYGSGTDTARDNVEDTRGILDLLGLGKERLKWATFLPEEAESLSLFLRNFAEEIQKIGPSPVMPTLKKSGGSLPEEQVKNLLVTHDIYACQDCGKCTSACPLTLAGRPFSPRALAGEIIAGHMNEPSVLKDIWGCLTCGLCYDRCPSAVNFAEFIRDIRQLQQSNGRSEYETHGGFFHSLMRTMTSPNVEPKRWKWLPEDIQIDSKGKILFFGGCAPYFDVFFRKHLGVQTGNILVDSLRLLNFFDIHPALLEKERCCGHDLLWSGDRENFLQLANLNRESIAESGIEEIVTACPECYWALARDYPSQGVNLGVKVTHIFELLEREIERGGIGFERINRKITFQAPCRLARLEDRLELPRKLIHRLQVEGFREMSEHGPSALCCGNCAWIGCDAFSKALQVNRLRQAHETASNLLVTACPKCQIHLRCAMEDPHLGKDLNMEMIDLTSLIAQTIRWK
jgi:heterodisulfide reductase subunit D